MDERYYTADDMEVHEKFIKIPLVLLEDEFYRDLSNEAKLAYGVLSDRMALSYRNREKWTDEEGNVYIVYTNEQLCRILNKSNPTVVKIKRELQAKGLLIEKPQGANKPNFLYPVKPRVEGKNSLLQDVKNFNGSKTNNNQTNNNQTDSSRSSSSNNIISGLVEKFEKNFGRLITPFELEDMQKLVSEENFSPELVEDAMREAVLGGKPAWKYVVSILNRYKREGLLTLELVQAQREAWNKQHEKQRPNSNPAGNIPTWSRSHPDHPEHAKYLEEERRRLNQKPVRDMTDEEFEAEKERIRNLVFDDD